jgi:hypothetical protein
MLISQAGEMTMANTITTLNVAELSLIAGGVTEGPDGQGCTEHDLPKLTLGGHELQGGPAYATIFGN